MRKIKKVLPILLGVLFAFALVACEKDAVDPHVHTLKKTSAKKATCVKEGNTDYWTCTDCERLFSDANGKTEIEKSDTVLAKLPHTAEKSEGREANCEQSGRLEYWTCTKCDNTFEDEACTKPFDEVDAFLGYGAHTLTHHEEVVINCKEPGVREYWSCSVCNKMYAEETCKTALKKEDLVLYSNVHTLTHHEEIPVNGKENGVKEHWECSVCEKMYADEACTTEWSKEDIVIYSVMNIPDFVVEVPEGRDPVVLQLSDTQIIDAGQTRPGRTGVDYDFWATDQVEERCYDYVTETIEQTKPDFIIITGDVIYGEFDDNGSVWTSFVQFMDSFEIPWSPVFGNHENESKMGVDWQCEQLENAEYCLFEQKTLTGNGNYSVGIAQGNELKRVFYMLDTNGCGAASAESLANGHTTTSVGFGSDQIEWYTKQINTLKEYSPDTKISFAYHIQQAIFADAYAKYGFNQAEKYQDIHIDLLEDKAEGDFGYIGRQLKGPWDTNYTVWKGMKALGVDSVFVGHEHCNSASVVYDGVRFQFGQKSSEYDRFNCVDAEGNITGGYSKTGTSLIGGTVICLSETDGSINNAYIYYCEEAGGKIDWDSFKTYEVDGLQYGGIGVNTAEMWADGAVVAQSVAFDETVNAYKVTANDQGKLYVNTALLKGKTTFTFTVYVPETSTVKLGGLGEFAIRVKPDGDEPSLDGSADGYIDYDSSATDDALKLEFGVWKTFTVDITGLDATCTEFAFVIAKGNEIYLRDVAVS
ncbi:MAG: metallophosphoesterase [Clostridia bacterium]|nr:metallophosphoesterase [Clostridia bacterium]